VISVPSTSEECLYDVIYRDLTPIGGTGGPRVVTDVNGLLCPGKTKYIAGPTMKFSQAPESGHDAIVEGVGYYSGTLVSSKDDGAVKP